PFDLHRGTRFCLCEKENRGGEDVQGAKEGRGGKMEPSSPLVPFPLLTTPVESTYRPCTIPYRFPSDDTRKATPTELEWIELFRKSIPSFRKRAAEDTSVENAAEKAEKFDQRPTYYTFGSAHCFALASFMFVTDVAKTLRYTQLLEDLKRDPESHGGPPDCILLCRLREQVLRELGFKDIFKKVKDDENAKAIALFEGVVRLNDAIEDEGKRVESLIRGIFAGNIFDLGSSQLAEMFARDGMSFMATCESLVPRPWVIDDLDIFKHKWSRKSWKKAIFFLFLFFAVIFVDNSGADVILGILPFARELLRHGTQVVLAANDLPSINDITYHELLEIVSKLKDEDGCILGVNASGLLIANSGNDLPVIDLSAVSPELAYLANDADLVMLEGMGRGIETNLYAQFRCDSLKIGMVKHPEVAQFLGGRLYDCVFKYTEVFLS
ncbi:Uncharacterized protein EJ110_NYTH27435, partial [Nymphaea thermarum]